MRRTGWLAVAVAALVAVAVVAVGAAVLGPDPGLDSGPDASPDTGAGQPPYRDPALPVAQRVEDLLARMSLADKLGQLALVERRVLDDPAQVTRYRLGAVLSGGGSTPPVNTPAAWADMYDRFQDAAAATPLGIPILYGIDAVHGLAAVRGATVFPHNIGLGATRDPDLVQRVGRATATEMAGIGVDWNFGPCLCVARDDRWGRTYESFGEDPALVSELTSMIDGLQGPDLAAPASVLATAKHYLGDGGTTGGVDQGDTVLSEEQLRRIHLAPFAEAVRREVGAVMVSYSSWNGEELHGHRYLITEVLKGELGFDGFVVSDLAGIDQLDGAEGFTGQEVATALNAGIDMVMVPDDYQRFLSLLREEVAAGRVPVSRIDDANRRILGRKIALGLFERRPADRSYQATIGSPQHRRLARAAVAASQVVLKNDAGTLPLPGDPGRIFVAGKNADDIGNQCGGWTISWQGESGPITPGTTILEGIEQAVAPGTTVTYDRTGVGIDAGYDVAVAVIGERPYAEFEGDRPGGVSLDAEDLATLARLGQAGVPLVVVLISGRPMDVTAQLPGWDALVAGWLPGTEGAGVADVLFGTVPPTGRLPVSWPAAAGQQPVNHGDGQRPLFPYGFGLTYE